MPGASRSYLRQWQKTLFNPMARRVLKTLAPPWGGAGSDRESDTPQSTYRPAKFGLLLPQVMLNLPLRLTALALSTAGLRAQTRSSSLQSGKRHRPQSSCPIDTATDGGQNYICRKVALRYRLAGSVCRPGRSRQRIIAGGFFANGTVSARPIGDFLRGLGCCQRGESRKTNHLPGHLPT